MSTGQRFAVVAGGAYVIVGIVGFLLAPDIFDIFGVNALHNVLHLGFGVAWLWVFPNRAATRTTNLIAGVVLLVLASLGFAGLLDVDGVLNLNAQQGPGEGDNWLHGGTGALAVALSVRPFGRSPRRPRP